MDSHLDETIARLGDLVPAVGESANPLSAGDIRAIEKRIGRSLDPTHRDLLTRFGASRFEGTILFEPERAFPKTYSKSNRGIVDVFLGKVNEKFPRAKAICILRKIDLLEDELPIGFLPVADNGAGDLYGLKEDGSVELWIHDAPEGKDICFVARSFTAWLDRLKT